MISESRAGRREEKGGDDRWREEGDGRWREENDGRWREEGNGGKRVMSHSMPDQHNFCHYLLKFNFSPLV